MNATLWYVFLVLVLVPSGALADGGTLRLLERNGPYQISVFTDPNPFRAGPVDVSVLVQDAEAGTAIVDAEVGVAIAPAVYASAWTLHPATQAAATNKLFYSAKFELPQSGQWSIEIRVDGPRGKARVALEVEAAESLPRWQEMWVWIFWPVIPIGLFIFRMFQTRWARTAACVTILSRFVELPGR